MPPDIREIRKEQLAALLGEQTPPKKSNLARLLRRSPSQVSQWLSGYRTITEESAREIERNARKPERWLDGDLAARDGQLTVHEPPPPYYGRLGLASALEVLGLALARDMPAEQREDIADALAKLARRQGSARDQGLVLTLIEAPSEKRQSAA